jgi:exoribonuclease-2
MLKRMAAVAMQNRIGQTFSGVVTGASQKGVYVRVTNPPVEGRVMLGEEGLDVGDRVRVSLLSADPVRGFIDFARAS